MKIEKRGKNSYRVKKMVHGNTYSITYDHKPTDIEVMRDMAEIADSAPVKGSFFSCAHSYIESKSNILSPKTIREYLFYADNSLPDDFKKKNINQITQQDIQSVINDYSVDHAPKTVRNVHAFISAVLGQFRPSMAIRTTLPQKLQHEPYTPSEDDVRRILEASKDDHTNHIIFKLGCMGLRRSEIAALELSDIEGNTLSITKAKVQNKNLEWVIKSTKTGAGRRRIYISDSLVKEIREQGYVYNRHPGQMLSALNRYQDKLGIPRFRFHDLRHFCATYAHYLGVSEANIMYTLGWESDYTMKRVYRHEMNTMATQKRLFDGLLDG